MKSSTVRIDEEAQAVLRELAEREGQPMRVVLKHAIEEYRRSLFLKQCGDAYADLQSDDKALDAELADRELWDLAVDDGIEGDA